jgi:hypothetical protein
MPVFQFRNLELHAWHGCNLGCESCAHYSSLGAWGGPSVSELRLWMELWAPRLRPEWLSLLGGEPTLNKRLVEVLRDATALFPHSRIRLVSNGFLLHRHPELPAALAAAGPGRAVLEVSAHHQGGDYQARFAPVRDLLLGWQRQHGIHIRILDSEAGWTRRYGMAGRRIEFGDGEPRQAWENCVGKSCRQLYLGKLWKCPPLAYFGLLEPQVEVAERWRQIAATHRPLEARCSDAELEAFLRRQEEPACRICPSKPEHFALPNPLRGVAASTPS